MLERLNHRDTETRRRARCQAQQCFAPRMNTDEWDEGSALTSMLQACFFVSNLSHSSVAHSSLSPLYLYVSVVQSLTRMTPSA